MSGDGDIHFGLDTDDDFAINYYFPTDKTAASDARGV